MIADSQALDWLLRPNLVLVSAETASCSSLYVKVAITSRDTQEKIASQGAMTFKGRVASEAVKHAICGLDARGA